MLNIASEFPLGKGVSGHFSPFFLLFGAQDHADEDPAPDQRAAPVADEGERQPRGRDQAQIHPHVEKCLQPDDRRLITLSQKLGAGL